MVIQISLIYPLIVSYATLILNNNNSIYNFRGLLFKVVFDISPLILLLGGVALLIVILKLLGGSV